MTKVKEGDWILVTNPDDCDYGKVFKVIKVSQDERILIFERYIDDKCTWIDYEGDIKVLSEEEAMAYRL